MTVLITLTTAGSNSGPFNLYSNLDGYTSAFATGISKSALLAGYSSAVVPNGTSIVRVISTGVCTNYIDITLTGISTTTTTTTVAASIYINTGSPSCRSTGNCNDNSTCGVLFPVTITGAPIGYYVQAQILSSSGATASYTPTQVQYTEDNALGTVNIKLNLYNYYGGTIIATNGPSGQTINHQSYYQYLNPCS